MGYKGQMFMNAQILQSSEQSNQFIEPSEWLNFWRLACKTTLADRNKYQQKERPMLINRLWQMLYQIGICLSLLLVLGIRIRLS